MAEDRDLLLTEEEAQWRRENPAAAIDRDIEARMAEIDEALAEKQAIQDRIQDLVAEVRRLGRERRKIG